MRMFNPTSLLTIPFVPSTELPLLLGVTTQLPKPNSGQTTVSFSILEAPSVLSEKTWQLVQEAAMAFLKRSSHGRVKLRNIIPAAQWLPISLKWSGNPQLRWVVRYRTAVESLLPVSDWPISTYASTHRKAT
jgi:hypothetical protein